MLLDSQPFLQRIENKGSHVFVKEARLIVGSMIKVAQGPQLLFRVYQILLKKIESELVRFSNLSLQMSELGGRQDKWKGARSGRARTKQRRSMRKMPLKISSMFYAE